MVVHVLCEPSLLCLWALRQSYCLLTLRNMCCAARGARHKFDLDRRRARNSSASVTILTCAVNRGVRTRVGTCSGTAPAHWPHCSGLVFVFNFSRLWFFGLCSPFGLWTLRWPLHLATCNLQAKPPSYRVYGLSL